MRIILHTLLFCLFFNFYCIGQNANDDLNALIENSKDNSLSLEEREDFAIKVLKIAKERSNDSLIIASRRTLSLIYLDLENYDLYTKLSRRNLIQANSLNDSTSIASAYLNLGQSYYFQNTNDSAYYYFTKALKIYKIIENKDQQGFILSAIADIQEVEKDYFGSEESAIQAIKLYESLPKTEYNLSQLWQLNNLLGIISLKLGSYNKSLEYHQRAEDITGDLKNGFYNKIFSTNNIAFVYRKLDDFEGALELYKDLVDIRDQYDDYDPTFYPLVIDNIAYTQFVSGSTDYVGMEQLFKEAYQISNRIEDDITKLQISIDLSKFYIDREKIDSSKKYAYQAHKIAKKISSNELRLEALKVLSKLEPGEKGKIFLNEHIRLSDSLLQVERNVRNKFARIEFETDKIEAENIRISQQRMWLLIVSGVLLVTLFLLYVIITQRTKNKELQFEKDQQKANEEIYNLMLSQQDKVDEARANEKKRISQEIHDGILGRLFGTRLSLDSLNFSEGKEAAENRASYIKELMTIENDIRKISHDLNTDFVSGSGFIDILKELVEKQTKAYRLGYKFSYADDISWEVVSNKNKINIYRIVQESMQNIYKHAEANEVKISIASKNNVILITIADDGRGFDINKSKKGIGIKNINSRVSDLGGFVQFSSEIGKGTTIDLEIPYKTD